MENYDPIDRENGEIDNATQQPAPASAANEATAEPITPATSTDAPAEEQPAADSDAKAADTAEPTDARASVSYTPSNHYNPYGSSYQTPPRQSTEYRQQEPDTEKRAGRTRIAVLCSILAIALLVATFFGGAAFGRYTGFTPDAPQGGEQNPDQTPGGDTPTDGGNGINRGDVTLNVIEREPAEYDDYDIPTVVKKVQDTVVEIRTETTQTSAFYGDYVTSGAGSGVIIDESGLILTCDHVINGAGSITVVLNNGAEYVAEVYGQDSWTDLALLKINATDLPAAVVSKTAAEAKELYDSYLAVGEEVIAIGNPLGELGGSVSNGIISALGRRVSVEGVPMTLLQTNAAVNPGNSGGGLFNMYGELIGIVNAKSTGDSVEGIGFAIPISDAVDVYRQLYKQGYVSGRPFLGLYFESSSSGLKILSYDYNDELTGGQTIQNGDMLYSVDGTVVTSLSDLRSILAEKKVGDTMVIQVERYERYGYTYRRIPLEFTITVHEYVPASDIQ